MDDWCRDRLSREAQAKERTEAMESCEVSYVGVDSQSTNSVNRSPVIIFGYKLFTRPYLSEVKLILRLHIPFFFTCFFQFFLQTISVIMCGHLSAKELAAAALACTLINVGAIGVGVGVSTACDTYFSQTFGSGNKKRVGLYLQRSLIVMYMVLIPVLCLQLNIKPVLKALGQDEDISSMAAEYMLIFLPGIFFDYTFLILSRYLQNQNLVYPPLVCAVIGNVFNAVTQYIAIIHLNMRYQASAACQAASLMVMCVSIIGYILYTRVYEATWDGWTRESWYDIGSFVKLAVPGLILTLLEDLSYEVATFIAGIIDPVQLAAQGVVFQTATLSYMMQLAMSIAVNIRVGHQLGAKDAEGAKHTFKVAHTLMTAMTFTLSLVILFCRPGIARIFTNSQVVQDEAEKILLIFSIFIFIDCFAVTNNGLLKGCGKQLTAAIFNVIGYEFVGLPIGIPLSLLTDLKIRGMWLGLMAGVFSSAMMFTFVIARLNWPQLVAQAHARAHGQSVSNVKDANVQSGLRETTDESVSLIGERSRCRSYSGRYENLLDVDVVSQEAEREADMPRTSADLARIMMRRCLTILMLMLLVVASVGLRLTQSRFKHSVPTNFTTADNSTTYQ